MAEQQPKPVVEPTGPYRPGMVVISEELQRRLVSGEVLPPITQTKDGKTKEPK